MNFNDLLKLENIEPDSVILLRHTPKEPSLAKVLPWLVDKHPLVFNAYQQQQGLKVEKAILQRKYVASFIGTNNGQAVFAGLYAQRGSTPVGRRKYWSIKENQKLREYGVKGIDDDPRSTVEWLHLERLPFHRDWIGKLIIHRTGRATSWHRRAENGDYKILAITQENAFVDRVPDWRTMCLTWSELSVLPANHRKYLEERPCIYHIKDVVSRKCYVGSAGGKDNLFGRLENYRSTGDAGNKLLLGADFKNFRFSILERLSPDLSRKEVLYLEDSWKRRLMTRNPHGLNGN